MEISHAKGIIDTFALVHNLTIDISDEQNDAGQKFVYVDLGNWNKNYVAFDYYYNTNEAVSIDSDSDELKTFVQDKLFPLLTIAQN